MASGNANQNHIMTGRDTLMKVHYEYDEDRRVTHMYQAAKDAAHGAKCLVTKNTYTGSFIEPDGSTEYEGEWDEAWDIEED